MVFFDGMLMASLDSKGSACVSRLLTLISPSCTTVRHSLVTSLPAMQSVQVSTLQPSQQVLHRLQCTRAQLSHTSLQGTPVATRSRHHNKQLGALSSLQTQPGCIAALHAGTVTGVAARARVLSVLISNQPSALQV
jgi:hypothetical protein